MGIGRWVSVWAGQQQRLEDSADVARWLVDVAARPAVQAGSALHIDRRGDDGAARAVHERLFQGKA